MMNKSNEKNLRALDQGFKTVVHNCDILSWMIRNNVDEFKGRSIDEIKSCLEIGEDGRTVIGRENEYGSVKHGKIVADTVFDVKIPGSNDQVSVIVNLEGQYNPNPGYPLAKRAEYYTARLVSSQKGIDFSNDEYGKLRKVYSIWYILHPRVDEMNTILSYRMRLDSVIGKMRRDPPVLETFNILMVNVGRYESDLPEESAFPAALFSDMDDNERQNVMISRFKIEFDDSLREEVRNVVSLGEDAYKCGLSEGIEIGTERGIEIGTEKTQNRWIENISDTIVRLCKEEGLTKEKAMALIQVSDEDKACLEEAVDRKMNLR